MIVRRLFAASLLVLAIGARPSGLWREISVESPTAGTPPPSGGNVAVLDGFGAVSRDGSEVDVCVSFQNNATKTASRIRFEYRVMDGDAAIASAAFNADGTFSPGVPIRTYGSFSDFLDTSAYPSVAVAHFCLKFRPSVPPSDLRNADRVTYAVTRVDYKDGTSWNASSDGTPVPQMLPGAQDGIAESMGEKYSAFPLAMAAPDGSNIEFLRGFAAVPSGGASIDVCAAFKNTSPKTASLLKVEYSLIGEDGSTFGVIPFVRKGTFATNVAIQTYAFLDYISPMRPMNGGFYDNCAIHKTTSAPFWNSSVRSLKYKVTRVEYTDGTSWSAAP